MEPWPAESTKRSRSAQFGSAASNFRYLRHSVVAASAMPIGMPGMAGFGGFHRIDGERADGVGHDAVFGEGARQDFRLSCQSRFVA